MHIKKVSAVLDGAFGSIAPRVTNRFVSSVLDGAVAARFVPVVRRINTLLDLQLAAEIPLLETLTSATRIHCYRTRSDPPASARDKVGTVVDVQR